jgi:Cu2+-exporting ATPase
MPGMLPCTHCGTPTPGEVEPVFCCSGCQAVHAALNEAGLADYYALRTEDGPVGVAPPAEGRYAHFDDPAFLTRFSEDGAITLHLDGVHCAACVWVIERLPQVVPGVQSARLDFGRQQVRICWDAAQVALSDIAMALHRLGYAPTPIGVAAQAAESKARRRDLVRLGITGALAGNAMMLAGALYAGADGGFGRLFEWLSLLLATPAVTYGAWPFYRSAWSGVRLGVVHLDLPIVIGLLTGFFASVYATIAGHGAVYYDSATALVFLLLAGRFAQTQGQRAAMNRAELLTALTPGAAWRWQGDRFESVPATQLQPGDRVRVRAGEGVPADGRIIDGRGTLDVRLLTGESRPLTVERGGRVWAGTTHLTGSIEIEVLAAGEETRVGRLLRDVTNDAERAPILARTDALASRFVAAVLLLAAIGGLSWWFIDPAQALPVVIALLVVTCPCALGLATPVALAVARAQAGRAGILLRSTAALERLAAVERVCFDKTGTLTEGALQIIDSTLPARWRGAVGVLASHSTHPVSRALAQAGQGDAQAVQETAGRGISGRVDGHLVSIGAPRLLAPAYDPPTQARFARAGLTPVVVLVDEQPVGLFGLGDTLRTDARQTVDALHAFGLSVEILSGDHDAVVQAAARAVGADAAFGAVSPEDKTRHVRQRPTLMVGDGLNDTGALRAAHASIAIQGGAEVALQVADVSLADTRLTRIVEAVTGARRALAVVQRNLRFSLIYNSIFAALALAGLISPLAAAVLMPISSLTVIGHSLLSRPFPNGNAPDAKRYPQRNTGADPRAERLRHAP